MLAINEMASDSSGCFSWFRAPAPRVGDPGSNSGLAENLSFKLTS